MSQKKEEKYLSLLRNGGLSNIKEDPIATKPTKRTNVCGWDAWARSAKKNRACFVEGRRYMQADWSRWVAWLKLYIEVLS